MVTWTSSSRHIRHTPRQRLALEFFGKAGSAGLLTMTRISQEHLKQSFPNLNQGYYPDCAFEYHVLPERIKGGTEEQLPFSLGYFMEFHIQSFSI